MKIVLKHISDQRAIFANRPLFKTLQQLGPDDGRAMSFVRNFGHFVMSFADLNRYAFRDTANADPWQSIVNAHTFEDDHHWPWYLHDLELLGLDDHDRFSKHLVFMWGDANRATRILSYELWALNKPLDGLSRLVMIEAIEATGEIFFGNLVAAAEKISPAGVASKLLYVGSHHFALEQGHSSGHAAVNTQLLDHVFSDDARRRTIGLVNQVFDLFGAWVDELAVHANAALEPAGDAADA